MSRQVSRGSAGENQADEQSGVARLCWQVVPESVELSSWFFRPSWTVLEDGILHQEKATKCNEIVFKVNKMWGLLSFKSKKKANVADCKICSKNCFLDHTFFKKSNCFNSYLYVLRGKQQYVDSAVILHIQTNLHLCEQQTTDCLVGLSKHK